MSFALRSACLALTLTMSSPVPAMPEDAGEASPVERVGVSDESPASALAPAAESDAGDPLADELGVQQQHGVVALPGGIAQLDVPAGFYYLTSADTEKVLVAWGNPPGNETLGMLVPVATGIGYQESWAVVITYDDSGHVADDDAAEIDYEEMLADMKDADADENAARKEAGYPTVSLIGWAEPPHYDASARKIYWAKRLRFEGEEQDTLNYSVRVLGREGVLELNAVASMSALAAVREGMPSVIAMASFKEGQRYEDFNGSTDRMAAYGLAALVAGGVAAKVGLWAKLVALLLAFKKIIILGVIAGGAWLGQFFFRKGKDKTSV